MTDDQNIDIARRLGQTLKSKSLKMTIAESCTGGGICAAVTANPGSSHWFDRGIVAYSYEAKQELLDVKPETLKKYGAVSQETAIEMVEGALKNSAADVAIAVTGIAGPEGGLPGKPVGLVWFAWAGKSFGTFAHKQIFTGSRHDIQTQAVHYALRVLLETISKTT